MARYLPRGCAVWPLVLCGLAYHYGNLIMLKNIDHMRALQTACCKYRDKQITCTRLLAAVIESTESFMVTLYKRLAKDL
jgi:hypothetical protein